MTVGWVSRWHVDTLRLGWYAPVQPGHAGFVLPGGASATIQGLQRARGERIAAAGNKWVPQPGVDVEDVSHVAKTHVWVDDVPAQVCGAPRPYQLGLKTSDFDVWLAGVVADPDEQAFPSAMVTFRSAALRVGLVEVVERARRFVATAFGVSTMQQATALNNGPRAAAPWRDVISRIDVACDVITDEVTPHLFTRGQFVTRSKAAAEHSEPNVVGFAPWDPPAAVDGLARYWSGRRHTGYTLGSRGRRGIQQRLYDKWWHARRHPDAAHVLEAWKREGWDGHAWVDVGGKKRGSGWRCEFEVGAEPAKRLGYGTLATVLEKGLGGLVGYLVGDGDTAPGWVRVVFDDETAPELGHGDVDDRGRQWTHRNRPEEREVLPFWDALRKASKAQQWPGHVVTKQPAPLRRGTANLVKQATGCLASFIARTGASPEDIQGAFSAMVTGLPEAIAERAHEVPYGSDVEGLLTTLNRGLHGWLDGLERTPGEEQAGRVPLLRGSVGDVLRESKAGDDVRGRNLQVRALALLPEGLPREGTALGAGPESDSPVGGIARVAGEVRAHPGDGAAWHRAVAATGDAAASAREVHRARYRAATHAAEERCERLNNVRRSTLDALWVLQDARVELAGAQLETLQERVSRCERLVERNEWLCRWLARFEWWAVGGDFTSTQNQEAEHVPF